MSELDLLLERYRSLVQLTWPAEVSGAERVWFVVYAPTQERRLRLRITDFEVATRQAGHGWTEADLTDSFAHWMATHEYHNDYFAEPEYVESVLPGFGQAIAHHVQNALAAADTKTVVALHGLSALFGMASVSELVNAVSKSIRGRLLVFFPGEKEGSNDRFWDARDGWNYLSIAITAKDGGSP